MMTRENARRKVRLLEALAAPGSGALPAEADTARALAKKLTLEHGLTPEPRVKPFIATHFANGSTFTMGAASGRKAGVSVSFTFSDDMY